MKKNHASHETSAVMWCILTLDVLSVDKEITSI